MEEHHFDFLLVVQLVLDIKHLIAFILFSPNLVGIKLCGVTPTKTEDLFFDYLGSEPFVLAFGKALPCSDLLILIAAGVPVIKEGGASSIKIVVM